jgi:sugar phosphate isomerase/epimerase
VRVAYHNHHFEFSTLEDGSTLWDRVSAPDAGWQLEPDAGWLLVGGRDPVEVLRGLAGRCPLVHAKDVRPVGPEWTDVPVGDGLLDWPGIVAAVREGGTEWLIVEFDTPTEDTLGDIGRSLDALRRELAA